MVLTNQDENVFHRNQQKSTQVVLHKFLKMRVKARRFLLLPQRPHLISEWFVAVGEPFYTNLTPCQLFIYDFFNQKFTAYTYSKNPHLHLQVGVLE